MEILYNILIKSRFSDDIPISVQKACIKSASGFLGEHYVNQFGRVFDGLDKNTETYYEAEFDFFNRYESGTLDDAFKNAETKKLFLGGDEQIEFEENIEQTKWFKNFLEVRDPTIFFYSSWGKYRNATVPEPFKIETPLGAQDSHVHILPSLNIIQFYKPSKDIYWYDYDTLKHFFWGAMFADHDLWREQGTTKNPIKKYITIPKQKRELKKIQQYNDKLLALEPIDRINIDNNYVLPETKKDF